MSGDTKRVLEVNQIDNLQGSTQRVKQETTLNNLRGFTQRVYVVGGDQHNLGWYATPEALEEAHPTAEAGDFAVVGSTDTVWIWDTDTSAWVDSDTKGQVASVNGQTGTVTLTASDVGALPDNTHIPVDPVQADWDETDSNALDYIKNKPTIPAAQVNSDWNANSGAAEILNKPTLGTMASESASDYTPTSGLATVATTGAYSDLSGTPTIPEAIQVSTMPTAAAGEVGKVYQFIGTTDANYTHGYFYECTAAGDPAVYSWTQTDVQPSSGGGGLPDQTGNAGKFLTTDGTDASWSDKPLVNRGTGTRALAVGGGAASREDAISVGMSYANANGDYSIAIGNGVFANGKGSLGIGKSVTANSNFSIAIGHYSQAQAANAIQLGTKTEYAGHTNSDANTFKVGNANGNFEIMSADGTIPAARHAALPSADGTYVLKLVIADGTPTLSWVAE